MVKAFGSRTGIVSFFEIVIQEIEKDILEAQGSHFKINGRLARPH